MNGREPTLEDQLIAAGFRKVDATRYEHGDGRVFYRDTRSTNRWCIAEKGKPVRSLSRYQGEAIGKLLGVKWRVLGEAG